MQLSVSIMIWSEIIGLCSVRQSASKRTTFLFDLMNFKMRLYLRGTLLKATWSLTKSYIEVLIGALNKFLLYAKWEFPLKCFKQWTKQNSKQPTCVRFDVDLLLNARTKSHLRLLQKLFRKYLNGLNRFSCQRKWFGYLLC